MKKLDARALKQRILQHYSCRFHMSLILTAVIASGMLSSKLLLVLGLHSLRLRYPISVLVSYAVFLLLIRLWIAYVDARRSLTLGDVCDADFGGLPWPGEGGGGGGSAPVRFGGGSSGGGGASDTWTADTTRSVSSAPGSSSSSGSRFLPDIDLDLGDDGWVVLLVLIAVVLAILIAGGYLVYAAPQILPDAAAQALLAPALLRLSKEDHHGWMPGVLRSTALPFGAVLVMLFALGWTAHHACPSAAKLMDVFACPAVEAPQ